MSDAITLASPQEALLSAFLQQQRWCRLTSPFTARLMALTISWLECEGTPEAREAMDCLSGLSAQPLASAVPLRWAAALHRLALQGLAPWQGLWPSTQAAGSEAPPGGQFRAGFDQAWREQQPLLQQMLRSAPQTNEVARSSVLLPGLLQAQAAYPAHAIHLLELGSSAGLNLLPDAWHHDYGCWQWAGPAAQASGLRLQAAWQGPAPAAALQRGTLHITERRGCDVHPLPLNPAVQPHGASPAMADAHLRHLLSFVWADQPERLARLRTATAFARSREAPALQLHRQRAAVFLAEQLAQPVAAGTLRVVMHSIVWQYLPPAEQIQIEQRLAEAGAQATPERPLVWLRMEPPAPDVGVELWLTQWPGAQAQRLAICHPHGQHLRWLGDAGSA